MLELVKKIILPILILTHSANARIAKIEFPKHEWQRATFDEAKINKLSFKEFENFVFDKEADYKTDSIVLIRNGKLVYERYENGYDASKLHLLWSASKSVTNILTGILIKKKVISLDDKVTHYYPEIKGKYKDDLTIGNLTQMSSGIAWNEGYEGNPLNSNVIRMLYTRGFKDMATYTSSLKIDHKPGTKFKYSSGETNLLMGVLKKSLLNAKAYEKLPWSELFNLLNIENATWERDHSGTYVGSSYLYLRPRDFAKIGHLYLAKGKWGNRTIVTKDWVKYSTRLAPSFSNTILDGSDNNEGHGAHWWLNRKIPKKGLGSPYPSAPEDLFMGLGHHGQMVAVLPSLDLVVVRTAEDKSGSMDKDQFFKLLINSLGDTK